MKKKNQKGFSLIELLIVVVIIGIIAAIAIPNLIAARRAANEGAAQSASRMIHSAEVTYFASVGNGSYGSLGDLLATNLIDDLIGTAPSAKSGYTFNVEVTNPPSATTGSFAIGAKPNLASGFTATGSRKFCVATDGIVYTYNDTLSVTATTAGGGIVPASCASGGTVIQ